MSMTYKLSEIMPPAFFELHRRIRAGEVTEALCEGGRGGAKSSFISEEIELQMMRHPDTHAVVLRRKENTLRRTVYNQYIWAAGALGVGSKWKATVSPMELTYLPTGQKIMFFGLDDPGNLKSIKLPFGYVAYVHFEELDQFRGPEEVRNVEQSLLRGGPIAITFKSFNPPASAANWANQYARESKPGQVKHHSTYLETPPEWLGPRFIADAEHLKALRPMAYESKVTEVSVLEHQYIKGTEEVTLFEGVAEEGDIIQFEEPAYGLEASGFSVQSSGANYAVLSAGTGTLTGKKYVHMTRDVRVPVSEDEVSNVVEVKEATLVSLTNSAAVAQRLAGYYQYIEALDHEVVYDGERPGDVVAFEHPYGGESKGCIKDTAITMGGRLVASEQAVIGYVPPKFETEEVLDERVVLTGSGDYTVPEGVYTLTVVCIQAGTGAQAGFDGEPGGGTQLIVTTKEQDAGGSWSDTQADGGEGGQKGAPGAGGKVYRATIDVVPGQVIHYECGTPGVGGATNGAVGAAGGETTFGDLSSAQGASSEIGYVDPVTEEELAKPGTEGVDGAAGGRGGQASSRGGDYGENGEDVPPNTGGPGGPPYGWKFDDYTSENVRIYGGGAGGGAAHGKDGEPGSDSPTAVGGAGASPDVPKTPDKIGAGGNGGHGGGGGGGAGGLFASAEAYGPSELPAGIWITKDGGSAGKGSPGSNGGPGGVILYFGVRKKLVSGPIRDKSGRALLDRLGRRLIV